MSIDRCGCGSRQRRRLQTLDIGSQKLQFRFQLFIAAIEMLNFEDCGGAVGSEGSDDQGCAGAEVGGADGASVQLGNPADNCRSVFSHDGCTEAIEFVNVLKAFRKHAVGNRAGSLSDGEQGCHLRLEIGRDSGEGFGSEALGKECGCALDEESISRVADVGTDAAKPLEEIEQLCDGRVEDADAAASGCGGDGECGCFDAIRKDRVISGGQLFDTVNLNDSRLGKFDAGTGRGEESGELVDFRFLSCVADEGGAAGEHCGGKDVAGAGDGGSGGAGEVDVGGCELFCAGVDPAVSDLQIGAERSEAFEVQIDGPRADATAARQWDGRGAEPGEHWSEKADAGAHAADERCVGRGGGGLRRMNTDAVRDAVELWVGVVGNGNSGAGGLQQQQHGLHVKERRQVADDAGALDGERGGEDGQRRILAAADCDCASQWRSSLNAKVLLQEFSPTDSACPRSGVTQAVVQRGMGLQTPPAQSDRVRLRPGERECDRSRRVEAVRRRGSTAGGRVRGR